MSEEREERERQATPVVAEEIAKAREHLEAAKARQSKNKGAAKGEGQ